METKVICISRQFGSGGHEIGVKTAAKLGIRVYEKELLHMACRYGGVSESTLRDSDERATNPYLFQGVYEGNYHVTRGLPTSEVLFSLQSHEIQKIAARESCVMVGRCADCVLRDEPGITLLRVFVSAPFEFRVQRKIEQEHLSKDKAVHLVKKIDRQRRQYYEHYTGQPWGDPRFYDINLDSSAVCIDRAVELIADRFAALRQPSAAQS